MDRIVDVVFVVVFLVMFVGVSSITSWLDRRALERVILKSNARLQIENHVLREELELFRGGARGIETAEAYELSIEREREGAG